MLSLTQAHFKYEGVPTHYYRLRSEEVNACASLLILCRGCNIDPGFDKAPNTHDRQTRTHNNIRETVCPAKAQPRTETADQCMQHNCILKLGMLAEVGKLCSNHTASYCLRLWE